MTPNTDEHVTAFRKGDRVEVTKWADRGETPTGTVANVDDESVFVQYDNSFVEDELDHADVRKTGGRGAPRPSFLVLELDP